MRLISATVLALAIVGCGTPPRLAAEHTSGTMPLLHSFQALTCPDTLLRGCCDAYFPKSMPCITNICCGSGPDAFCRKPCPFVSRFSGGCGDAYCPKPCPDLCRPLFADLFVCVPSSPGVRRSAVDPANSTAFTSQSIDSNSPTDTIGSPSVLRQPPLFR